MTDIKTQQFNDAQFTAWAYINSVRLVKPKTGQPYYSLSLSGLQGTKESPVYLKIRSGNVHGAQAIAMASALYEYCRKDKNNGRNLKIFAYVKLSDLTPSIFYIGDEPKISMMGRLFSITNVMIDDVKTFNDLDVYEDEDVVETVKATDEQSAAKTETKPTPSLVDNISWGTEITASQSLTL